MITLLTGENSFEVEQRLAQFMTDFAGAPEKFDGAELELKQLPDLLMGMSLFSEQRLVVIRGLSGNKPVWDALPDWLERMSDDIHLVLVEAKPDKRTRSYKALQKVAKVQDFKLWTERDAGQAERWVGEQATKRNIKLPANAARLLVSRAGVDQWQLKHALDKLSLLGDISEAKIRDVIEAQPAENVFELFTTALKGGQARVHEMISTLELSEDPYKLFGLLAGQAFQLAALAAAREGDDVARDIGAHPFVLSRLKPYAQQLGVAGSGAIIAAFAEADETMKTAALNPWLVIERTLLGVASNQ